MAKLIWLSYDLGVRGDYDNLYAWLDDHGAKECGNNVATLSYLFHGDLLTALRRDLSAAVNIAKRDRIYVIWREDETNIVRGRFVFGKRKAAPWIGFGSQEQQAEEEE